MLFAPKNHNKSGIIEDAESIATKKQGNAQSQSQKYV